MKERPNKPESTLKTRKLMFDGVPCSRVPFIEFIAYGHEYISG